MKIYLKFNHDLNDSMKAIGWEHDGRKVHEVIFNLIAKYGLDDSLERSSHLSELLHNDLDYEVILFLATKSIEQTIKDIYNETNKG